METLKFVVPLDPRTKKNHMQIVGKGPKCPTCNRPYKQFVKQGRAYDEYAGNAIACLTHSSRIPQSPISMPVHIKYTFYLQTHRLVDQNNLIAAMDDILVAAKVLSDDNCNVIKSYDGTRVLYDKENPRTEIVISPFEEVGD